MSDEPLPRLCLLAFSPVVNDARVLRQARYLAPYFQVTLAGFGADPFKNAPVPNVTWFELDTRGSVSKHYRGWQILAANLARLHPRFIETYYRHVPYWRHGWHLAQSARFRVIYCNDADTLPIGVAALKANRSAKLILDMHEYATRELGDNFHWKWERKPLVTSALKHYARKANGTVTVVDSFVPLFTKEFRMKKPVVVCNAPELIPLPPKAPSDGKVHLIHHGSCLQLRKLELMIDAMRYTQDRFILHMMLVGGEKEYLDYLREEAAKLPAGRVVFHDAVKPDEIVPTIAKFDIGVFLLPPVVFNYEHALPNKFFDFMSAGLGIAIGPSPNMAKMINAHGIGWIAPDFTAESFAKLLNALTPEDIEAKRLACMKARESVNAESEMSKLVALVRKVAAVSK